MPLPASVPVGTVIGRWWDTDGSDSTGTIVFLARELVEVPDLPQGVVLPIRYPVDITAGVLNVTLPAGFYDVSVRLSELYRDYKTVEVVAGQTLNLPDAIGVVPPEELQTPVRSVNGVFPDSSGNISVPASASAAVVNSSSWEVLVGPNVQSALDRADGIALNAMSTGVRAGGVFTVDGGIGVGTTVSITAASGQILDNTNPGSPGFSLIQAGPWTAQTPLYSVTYWYVDSAGVLQQSSTEPTREELRTRLYLSRTSMFGGAITGIAPIATLVQQSAVNVRDLAFAIGPIKLSGLTTAASGAGLTFQVSSGSIYSYGIAGVETATNPSTKSLTLFNTGASDTFRYTTNTTQIAVDRTTLDPGNYQVGGSVQPIPGPGTTVGVHWIFLFPSVPNYRLAYGTTTYTDFTAARAALGTIDPFSAAPESYRKNAFLVGAILATKNATNLSVASQAQFITTNAFGALGGGLGVAGGGYLTESMITAKGDLIAGDAVGSTDIRTVGTNGQVLTADSSQTTGLSWTTPRKIGEHRRYLTDATPDQWYNVPDTGGAWAIFSSPGTLILPASVGDRINMDFQVLTRGIGDWLVDVAVVTGATIKRYMSSGTSTPSNAGFPGGYPFTQGALEFQPVYGSGGFTVTSDDISGGNVTLSVVVKSTVTGGRFYASPNFVSQWSMRNIGPA